MPLEIKDIVVTMSVNASGNSGNGKSNKSSVNNSGGNIDDLVAECVEQVLDILAEKNER